MPSNVSLIAASLILVSASQVFAVPQTNAASPSGLTIPLTKRAPNLRTPEEWGAWAKAHREGLEAKYGNPKHQKRGMGTNL